jgi:hypothetical protein
MEHYRASACVNVQITVWRPFQHALAQRLWLRLFTVRTQFRVRVSTAEWTRLAVAAQEPLMLTSGSLSVSTTLLRASS